MKKLFNLQPWLAGLQWLFFLFTNTVVIPITIGAAFQLPQEKIITLLQFSFLFTGLASMLQALGGHKRSVMEGQSGLWWGVILSLCYAAPSQGMSLVTLGGSLAIGIILSGILTILIGLCGLATYISKLFNSGVMAVFMFLLGCRLNTIFLQGMLGIPFGGQEKTGEIDLPVFLFSCCIAGLVMIISLKATPIIRKYSLLTGIIVGWVLFELLMKREGIDVTGQMVIELFPLGTPTLDLGIIFTIIITGFLNTSNTFGALKGTDTIYHSHTTTYEYRRSFTISGLFTIFAGFFGLVPFAPYVSSIGLLSQTKIIERLPFILGSAMFMAMGIIPQVSHFMAKLPLSVGSAVLFVAYLRLLQSSLQYFMQINLTTGNLYRLAIPLFTGVIFMTFPLSYFQSIPSFIRPLMSNGLLMGILISILLENIKFKQYRKKKRLFLS